MKLHVEMEGVDNVRDYLRTFMERGYGGPSRCAKALGISNSHLSESMGDLPNRQLPRKLLDAADVVLYKGTYYHILNEVRHG